MKATNNYEAVKDIDPRVALNDETRAHIDHWLAKFPPERKRSALLQGLMAAQEQNGGWLDDAMIAAVAKYLELPPVWAYEVASFYHMYNLAPVGKHKLTLCTCLPCGLQGSLDAADHLRDRLGIDFNETTPDGRFTLKEGECMGACAMAPVLLVNDKKMHDYMSNDKLDALLAELAAK